MEKQIEEMAKEKCEHFNERVCYKIDCKTQCRYYGKANCQTCIHKSVCTFFETIDCEKEVKEYGCKHYQPKLPKDRVVLSREEYQDLKEYKNIAEQRKFNLDYANVELRRLEAELNSAYKKGSKETAEKILTYVGNLYDDGDQRFRLKDYQWHKDLCKQFGVEIKE